MTPQAIFAKLQAKFSDGVHSFTADEETKDPFCCVKPDQVVDVAKFLRDEGDLRFDFLQCLTGVDTKETLTTVYHLYSYSLKHSFVLKVAVPRDNPVSPSVHSVWNTANWHERESFDLLGIRYSGHPDLRRIMLPDDWEGHPLRKDFQEKDEYRGMPTTRYSMVDLLPVYDQHAVEQLKQGITEPPSEGGADS